MLTSSSVDKKKPLRMPWCVSGLVCRLCRDLEGGRAWREQTAELFNVMEVDWPCPRGYEWGWTGPSRGLGDTVAKVIKAVTFGHVKPCGGCKKRQALLNRLVPYGAGKET